MVLLPTVGVVVEVGVALLPIVGVAVGEAGWSHERLLLFARLQSTCTCLNSIL